MENFTRTEENEEPDRIKGGKLGGENLCSLESNE